MQTTRPAKAFDPVKHRTNPDGTPYLNRHGGFMPKANNRGGRPKKLASNQAAAPAPAPLNQAPGATVAAPTAAGGNPPAANPPPAPPTAPAAPLLPGSSAPAPQDTPPPDFSDVRRALENPDPAADPAALVDQITTLPDNATAETIIGIIQTGLVLIGEEEGFLTPTEKELVRGPLVRVLKKYEVGADVMPAEVDLALAVLGLFLVRLQKPKTATAWLKLKAWAVNFWFARKGAKLAATIKKEVGAINAPTPAPAP